MNDFLEADFRNDLPRMASIISADTENFGDLVKAIGFNPAVDFRFKNLEDVDFSNSDIRGYDFTGSSLRGAYGVNVRYDDTTIFSDCDLEGSIFGSAAEDGRLQDGLPLTEFQRLMRLNWQDQIIWLDGVQIDDANFQVLFELVFLLFYRSPDGFVKRHALTTIARLGTAPLVFALLRTNAEVSDDPKLFAAAFHVLKVLIQRDRDPVLKFCMGLLRTPWREEASIFLAEHLHAADELRRLTELARRFPRAASRKRYLNALASRFGRPVAAMLREPLTGDTADFGEQISVERIAMSARLMLRRIHQDQEKLAASGRPYVDEFKNCHNARMIRSRICSRLSDINSLGAGLSLPTSSDMAAYEPRKRSS